MQIKFPDIGSNAPSRILEVLVNKGDKIDEGDVLIVVESSKASIEIPAEHAGTVLEVMVSNEDYINAGENILILANESNDVVEEIHTSKKAKVSNDVVEEIHTSKKLIYASPAVRKDIREHNLDTSNITGTGKFGRITKEDIGRITKEESINNEAAKKIIKFSNIQSISAARLAESWRTIPHVSFHAISDITDTDELRKKLKKDLNIKLSILPFIVKAVCVALKLYPKINSSILEDISGIKLHDTCNIGIAVDTEYGLMVPVIKHSETKSILTINEEILDLSTRCKNKTIGLKDITGATFTISSLGSIGGRYFSPIINPPEVAILGISKSYDENGKLILPFSLSCDHRVIDGVLACKFNAILSELLYKYSLVAIH